MAVPEASDPSALRPIGMVSGLALGVLSGILLALPFLTPHTWPLHYVALVPAAILLASPTARRATLAALLGLVAFVAASAGPFSLFHWSVPLIMGIAYAPYLLLFPLVVRYGSLRLELPMLLLVPMAWVATEWIRVRFSIGQAALYVLGTAHFPARDVIQIAEFTGVAGVSFVVAAGSGALADFFTQRRRNRRRALLSLGTYLLLLAGVIGYGRARAPAIETTPGPRLALVQPNEIHYRDPETALQTFYTQLSFTRGEIARGRAELIAWPENAVSVPLDEDPRFLEELRALAQEQGAEIVFGAPTEVSRDPPRVHTSAYHLSERGELLRRYDKLHLIPWAEYIPFQDWLSRLSPRLADAHARFSRSVLGYESFGVPGGDLVLFETDGGGGALRFATPICFEITSVGFSRQATLAGADFLMNLTSEGVFGSAVYRHMLGHSTLRAVENRIAVVRVGNHGVSGFVTPTGEATLLRGRHTGSPWLEEGVLVGRVPVGARAGGTFYTRRGDLLSYLCAAGSAVVLLLAWRRHRSSPRGSATD